MALTTLAAVQAIPGMANLPIDFLTNLITQASKAIQTYCKQNIELATWTEYYSGNGTPNLPLRQMPVNSIINLWFDPQGYWGQRSGSFGSGTLQTVGTQYALDIDTGGTVSNRGLVRRIGGTYLGFGFGYYGFGNWNSKLAGTQLPVWIVGPGNIKVEYSAGFDPVPADVTAACNMLIAWYARNMPSGAPLSGENLGNYGYTVMTQALGNVPELGSIAVTLARYRETSL